MTTDPNPLPALPPLGTDPEIEVAWARFDSFAAAGCELHFATDPATGRLACELRDLDGRVAERLSPADALALACGDATPPRMPPPERLSEAEREARRQEDLLMLERRLGGRRRIFSDR